MKENHRVCAELTVQGLRWPAGGAQPAWSPDSDHLLTCAEQGGSQASELVTRGLGLIPGASDEGTFGLGSRGKSNLLLRKSGEPARDCTALSWAWWELLGKQVLKRKKRNRSPCFRSFKSYYNVVKGFYIILSKYCGN